MLELLENGILLWGEDLRGEMQRPTFHLMQEETLQHALAARIHGDSVGWLLDIARGIYTMRNGKVIAKTDAGEWAFREGLCPNVEALRKAIAIRKEPLMYTKADWAVDNGVIQRFADVLEREIHR